MKIRHTTLLAAGACALACFTATTAGAAPLYRIEPLPSNDQVVPIRAFDINNQGVVVGGGRVPRADGSLGDNDKPFRYRDGVTTRLSLSSHPDADSGVASSVNERGVAAGKSHHAQVWDVQGRRRVLARPPACRGYVFVGQINDVGQMAGSAECLLIQHRMALLVEKGVSIELGALPGDTQSQAVAINNAGQVAGASIGQPYLRAFRWEAGVMLPLGTLGGPQSDASAINEHGVVVGRAQLASLQWRPFLHDGATMHALPTCSKAEIWPLGINASAAVVGFEEGAQGGAVLIRERQCHRLADLLDDSGAGWTLTAAYDINDHGVIVGAGRFNGQLRAFVATPVLAGR